MNLGAKVDSSSTELRAFVKDDIFFLWFRERVYLWDHVYIVNLICRFLEYYSNNTTIQDRFVELATPPQYHI